MEQAVKMYQLIVKAKGYDAVISGTMYNALSIADRKLYQLIPEDELMALLKEDNGLPVDGIDMDDDLSDLDDIEEEEEEYVDPDEDESD